MSIMGLSHSERQMLADAYRIALWNVNTEIIALWFFLTDCTGKQIQVFGQQQRYGFCI